MADVFTTNKLASNSHRMGAIPATTEWKQWTELYELIPWDNADDLGHLLRLIASEQNSKNWRCRVLRNVDSDDCDVTTAGDANEEHNSLLKREMEKRDEEL